MITVEEAKQLLFSKIEKTIFQTIDISKSTGCVLSETVSSPIDLPSFNQSAMDGYALASSAVRNKQFEVIGEIKAGDSVSVQLKSGQAVRIFTGAKIPLSADAVVIQENVERVNGTIHLSDAVRQGDCIRYQGSQIKAGEVALMKGTLLNPASIGFLASIGIHKVSVYKKPDVSLITTGNELVKPGNALTGGQVYESNSFSLQAALNQMQIIPKHILSAPDEKKELTHKIKQCLNKSDVLILTGGISVGKYDLVHEVLMSMKVETIFYKVAQKPGKPFFCGKLKDKLIFALPGNPAAVLVCFYEYIYPAIRMLQGFKNAALPTLKLKLLKDISKKEDRAQFIRAIKNNDGVMPLKKQDSNMLRSFAEADSLIYIPIERQMINQDEEVEVHLLPFNN